MPEIGSACTGNVRFWFTPASLHQIFAVSGSLLSYGPTGSTCRKKKVPSFLCTSTSALESFAPPISRWRRHRPRWGEHPTIPGRVVGGDLLEPLGVPGARVDERRQAERRQEQPLPFIELQLAPMHV